MYHFNEKLALLKFLEAMEKEDRSAVLTVDMPNTSFPCTHGTFRLDLETLFDSTFADHPEAPAGAERVAHFPWIGSQEEPITHLFCFLF